MGLKSDISVVVVGMGEVGGAHYKILSEVYSVWGVDLVKEREKTNTDKDQPESVEVLLIAIRFSEEFNSTVNKYLEFYKPKMLNILSTVPCGTTEQFGIYACHSTTRGLHPNLVSGLLKIKKHIGGGHAPDFKTFYESAGIQCEIHRHAKTTELLHILNNCHYGINLMFADEAYKLCREYGVDYFDWMKYGESNNEGFRALGHTTKVRSVLTPPGEQIGGHCVVQSAQLIPHEKRPFLIDKLSSYNN